MRLKDKLSPYPILDNNTDDYINSSFSVDYNVVTQFSEIYGELKFNLNNEDIQTLIDKRLAEFVVHIESSVTCFREIYKSFEPTIDFKIDSSLVSKTIEIRTFIILAEDVPDYTSKSFHPDYQGCSFNLQAHQMIAIGTAKNYDITIDDNSLDSFPSIIKIHKSTDSKKGTLSVNTDNNDFITIGLSEDVYKLYSDLGRNTFKNSIFSLILLPAFIVVLQRMYNAKDDNAIKAMHWYQVIESLLNSNNYQVENLIIDNDSLLSICQSIFADPIKRSFKELKNISERL